MSYSPHLRTAVLLTGNGTGGAYHAGVLRALHEAGVKIDVMSGRGVGVVGALFAAIDAGAKTWEDGGVWRRKPADSDVPMAAGAAVGGAAGACSRWRFSRFRCSCWRPVSSLIR